MSEICTYYHRVLTDRMLETDRVEFLANCDYVGDRRIVSLVSGERLEVPDRCRIVDARYLSPTIPADTPPPFEVGDDVRVVPVNALARLEDAPSQYVVVGSGKTATDAIVWLLGRGVDPDAICWVRPRDPWMLNRAVVQPDPAVYQGMVADLMQAAAAATSLDEVFLRLEEAGVMLRIDPSVTPTMAKAPTLGTWELDLLRTVEQRRTAGPHPARGPRTRHPRPGLGGDRTRRARRPLCGVRPAEPSAGPDLAADGDHGAADPRRVPVLRGRPRRLRRGDPCGRRGEEPALPAVAVRQHPGRLGRHERARHPGLAVVRAEPDIKAWADSVALNPARLPPEDDRSAELTDALAASRAQLAPGLARLAELGGVDSPR